MTMLLHRGTETTREAWGVSDAGLRERYVSREREITRLQAESAGDLFEVERRRGFEPDHLTVIDFMSDRLGVSGTEARRRVAEARGLAVHRGVREAFENAQIDRPRVAMLLHAARVSPELFSRDERMLVDTIAPLPMAHAFRVIEYWRQAADREAAARDAEHLHRRRRLHLSKTLGGMVRVDGELDPEGGEIVLTALHSLTDRANFDADDTRSAAQRRADALIELCCNHLTHGDTPISGGMRPQITLAITPQTLAAMAPGELGDGTLVIPETVRRIACDATITRITTDRGGVLDVGRATRSIPSAIRKALVIRDQGCTHPGCGRPHRWCDAHHIVHWADGGPTALDNLRLLCRRHHRQAHEGAAPQRE